MMNLRTSPLKVSCDIDFGARSMSAITVYDGDGQDDKSDKWLTVGTDWEDTETDVPGGKGNLWEESWDDDDTSEDFSAQLRLSFHLFMWSFTVYHP